MKKTLIILSLFLLIAATAVNAGFFDFLTGKIVYDNMEEICKRPVSLNEGQTKYFNFAGDNYEITINSITGDKLSLTVNSVDILIPLSRRILINSKVSITYYSSTTIDNQKSAQLILNKEDDKCSCVSNDIKVKPNQKNIVSDGINEFDVEFAEFNYDADYPGNTYVIYKVNNVKASEKAWPSTLSVFPELYNLKIKTKIINEDSTIIELDNSANCKNTIMQKEAEEETPAIIIDKLIITKIEENDDSITYALKVPKETKDMFILVSGSKFDIAGKKIEELKEEKQMPAQCPQCLQCPPQKQSFWAFLGF